MNIQVNVEIIDTGTSGETLCFKLQDDKGNIYIIDDCYLKETFDAYKGYFGSYNGYPAHLNIMKSGNVIFLVNNIND